ncbi:hypothetical protein BOC55_33640 [Burkholderia pseudomallei]|nr:hypothetical protein BOC48_28675 [Burkholderia pseudomallei]ARL77312.1 hypothetical protein BOC54_35315 [Burkholderia pseudomallei]ARL83915.1 hypothetical protein BOC55_33640 [Burkholderia pseudomallei]
MPKKAARGAPDATKNAAACRHRAMPAAFRARRAMPGRDRGGLSHAARRGEKGRRCTAAFVPIASIVAIVAGDP